jgi:hypothetical protein
MTISKTLTRNRPLGNVFKWLTHPGFNLVSAKLVNPVNAALTLTDPCGLPVKASGSNYVVVLATDEANAIGLLYWDKPIDLTALGTSDMKYPFLLRGPALFDKDSLPTNDIAVSPAAYTNATLVTALAARNIIAQSEPVKTSQQTT